MAAYRPDWYPDPTGRFDLRYHNGEAWTADVSTDGDRYVDHHVDHHVDPESTSVGPVAVVTGPGDHASLPDPAPDRNRPAVAALVFGIVALCTSWLPYLFVVGAIAAVLAIVFATRGLRRSKSTGSGRGPAIAGLITGGLGVVGAIGGFFLTIAFSDAIEAYENPGPFDLVLDRCVVEASTWTAAGRVTNLDDEERSYTFDVGFARAGTDNVQRRASVALDDVSPGDTVGFEVSRSLPLDAVDCVVGDVRGPLPLGLDLN